MKMYMYYTQKKSKKKLIFESEHFKQMDDTVKIAIVKGEVAKVYEIKNINVLQIEKYKEKEDNKPKVINPLTSF